MTPKPPPPARAEIAPGIVLDSRLAIFHERDRWLVCADLHLGYEVNRRRGGGLFPLWGFAATAERLLDLADFYRPAALILAGDIVDGGGAAEAAADLLQRAGSRCGEVICLAGNHDRGPIRRAAAFADSFAASGFYFHHGHREAAAAELADQIEVVHSRASGDLDQ
ncbi:MAG: metallophosphoesterase [Verrucomicrobiales bacterium]